MYSISKQDNKNINIITEQSSKQSSDTLLTTLDHAPFIDNLKENKEIGPWEQENSKMFDLFCSELEGSKQFLKRTENNGMKRGKSKRKKIVKNEEPYQNKNVKDKSNMDSHQTQEDINQIGHQKGQDMIHQSYRNTPAAHLNNTQSSKLFYYLNGKVHEKKLQLVNQQVSDNQSQQQYHSIEYQKPNQNYENINTPTTPLNNTYLYQSEEKKFFENFKRYSLSLPKQNYQTKNRVINSGNIQVPQRYQSLHQENKPISQENKEIHLENKEIFQDNNGIYQDNIAIYQGNTAQNQGNMSQNSFKMYQSNSNQQTYPYGSDKNQTGSLNFSQQIGYFDSIQAIQVENLERKILQKYFSFHPQQQGQHQGQQQQQMHQVISPSPKNSIRNSIFPNKLNLSPKACLNNHESSSNQNIYSSQKHVSPNTRDIDSESAIEQTQLQQALKNQSIKFKKIKSLRSKFKPFSAYSSQESINTMIVKDGNEKCPLPAIKQKYSTQEDTPLNQQSSSIDIPILKGCGYGSIYSHASQPYQQTEKKRFQMADQSTTSRTVPIQMALTKQKYHHHQMLIQQSQQQQQQSLKQNRQPNSARDSISSYCQYSTINRQSDNQSRTNSMRQQSRIDSRDLAQIQQIRQSQKNEQDSLLITPLRNSSMSSPLDNKLANKDVLQQSHFTNSAQKSRNRSNLPSLILSQILDKSKNEEDAEDVYKAGHRKLNLEEAINNINSSRIVNLPLQEEKLTKSRNNYHLNSSHQTKYIQLYYYRQKKIVNPINSSRELSSLQIQINPNHSQY